MNKRFSELTVSATDFANDDVIAIDGETNGTRKMSGSALKSAMKANTLATADSNAYIVSNGDVVRIKDLATSITDFRTGDVIPVDGPEGTAKMSKDDLLKVSNAPDEEDLTTEHGKLKFKNRVATLSSKGYCILRKDKSFVSQVHEVDTIYEIRYGFDLGGDIVHLPEGCALKFVGGEIINGTIDGDNTQIISDGGKCFVNVSFSGTFNLRVVESDWFGLVSDFDDATGNGTDNTSALSSAVQLADKSRTSLHISAGSYGLDSPITMNDMKNVSIYGDGDKTILNQLSSDNRIFNTGSTTFPDFFELKSIKLVGRHRYNATLGNDANRLIGMYAKKARFVDVTLHHSRQMSLTCNADYIDVVRCEVMYSARDSINLTASRNAYVDGCRIIHCTDDSIAIHANNYMGTPINMSIRVVNNLIVDSNGIVCLGAQNCAVSNNILKRVKGYGIRVGGIAGKINPIEGTDNPCNIVVSDNVIEDVFNIGTWTTGTNLCVGIWVDAPKPSGSSDLGANLGQFDYTNHIFVKPWENGGYYKNGGYYTGTHAITIKNNLILKTLLATTSDNYESLLMGKTFSANGGMVDLTFAYNNIWNGAGIRVQRGAYIDACIESNLIEGFFCAMEYVDIPNDTSAFQVIKKNIFRNCFMGVNTDASTAKTNGILLFDGNFFDLDPYLLSGDRNTDGSWMNKTFNAGVCYLSSRFAMNVIFNHNFFRNIKSVGIGSYTVEKQGNTFFLEFKDTTKWSGPHKGCGSIIGRDSQIVFECSDPTSANYLSKLGVRGSFKAEKQPTSDYYMAGDVVINTGSDNTILCWKRKTNGNTHTSADWLTVTIPSA